MKIISVLLLLCASALAESFQQFPTGILGSETTNTVAALSTNTCAGATALEFGSASTIGFWLYYNASNGVNGTINFTFTGSPDGVDFVTARTNQYVVTAVTSGLSNVVAVAITNNTYRY